jgi:hypothetical protein
VPERTSTVSTFSRCGDRNAVRPNADDEDLLLALRTEDRVERSTHELCHGHARPIRFFVEERVLLAGDRDLQAMTHVM